MRDVDYLCAMGTYCDLGTAYAWGEPAPAWIRQEMHACVRQCAKKALGETIGLRNARELRPEHCLSQILMITHGKKKLCGLP